MTTKQDPNYSPKFQNMKIDQTFFSFFFRNGTSKPENPFEEEEWDEGDGTDNILVDNGEPGVPVKALYDYEGAESDELTFKQGEFLFSIKNTNF